MASILCDKLGRTVSQPLRIDAGKMIFKLKIAALLPAEFVQLVLKCLEPSRRFGVALAKYAQHADAPHPVRRLRARSERPRRRPANKHQLAPR
jgi:hypothetical protein